MDKVFIKINPSDKVCVALQPIKKGSVLDLISGIYVYTDEAEDGNKKELIKIEEDIPQGHKFALCDINKNEPIIKYGNIIGYATEDIKKGQWIHVHNMKTGLGDLLEYRYEPLSNGEEYIKPIKKSYTEAYFMGYKRPNGKVAVRNEIWIIPTVGCVNNVAAKIAELSKKYIKGNVEDIIAFAHPYGCSQMGEDQENTRIILSDLINHPNAAGVLVLGLGCENSNIEVLKSYLGEIDDRRVKFLTAQEHEDEIEDSIELIKELCEYASEFHREKIPASELIIGMKCGGSDGLSGITANPTVGMFSDLLISKGGTTILTEVPEMFGAEKLLMNRCADEELFKKTVDMINDFKNYFTKHGQTIYENPSPGNKKGGISSLEDKSLGCVQKSGSAKVNGVLKYGETIKEKGLNLLSAPGNDLVASTACAAAGAHIVLFTTGRGTPFASPVPTVKISTNNQLNLKKNNWIDFNCGELTKGKPMDELRDELFEYVLKVASGEKVKSEAAGFHDMAIFKSGVTL